MIYPPHTVCWKGNLGLLTLHGLSDLVIALAYFSLPLVVWALMRTGKGWRTRMLFPDLIALACLFVAACGVTHLLDLLEIFHSIQWLRGWSKAATALISVTTLGCLIARRREILSLIVTIDVVEQRGAP